MKQIWPLLSLVLIAAPLAAPAVAAAEGLTLRGGADEAVMVLAANQRDRDDNRGRSGSNRQRGNDDRQNDNQQRDNRQNDNRQNDNRQNGGQTRDRQVSAQRQGGESRDNRINRAMSVASSRGRVLDAGPQGGSVFWVRVATDHGRVDLLVDADSGRIIGER